MGLKVGYNLVAIVIIDVPASVGPKPLIPLLRHMSRLKGRLHPKVLEAAWAERTSSLLPRADRIYRP